MGISVSLAAGGFCEERRGGSRDDGNTGGRLRNGGEGDLDCLFRFVESGVNFPYGSFLCSLQLDLLVVDVTNVVVENGSLFEQSLVEIVKGGETGSGFLVIADDETKDGGDGGSIGTEKDITVKGGEFRDEVGGVGDLVETEGFIGGKGSFGSGEGSFSSGRGRCRRRRGRRRSVRQRAWLPVHVEQRFLLGSLQGGCGIVRSRRCSCRSCDVVGGSYSLCFRL